ncbi:amino acid adenylation domain-containing protein [Amycolatopsis sp. cmx-4-83]|uniref:amino acid adenylation domain-containing protein n=1 Tax=Amycolatopsis sp. cmx-4-83 TaxID=2790940 RepID=UPI00397AB4CC
MTLQDFTTLSAAVSASMERFAGRVAVEPHDGAPITYAELRDLVDGAASTVLGALPEATAAQHLVALVLDRSADYVVALLGALRSGGAYLPLDPAQPAGYLGRVLHDARPAVVVTDAAHRALVASVFDGPVVCLDDDVTAAGTPFPAEGHDPAYAIYTSGSTGTPNAVLVGNSAILASTGARLEVYGPAERLPLMHSVAFDVTVGTVFWALLGGGTLVLPGRGLSDVGATVAMLTDRRVSHLLYPSSLYGVLLEYLAEAPPATLRSVSVGGERWSDALVERHAAVLPGAALHNEYGPSEATVWCSQAKVYDPATGKTGPLTIGKPITGTNFVLDAPDGGPVPAGTPAELLVTGANLALGYLGRPELTARRFVTLASGERAYRTGDLVRRTTDGDHVFDGRVDRQVKVNGHRVEPGQVEDALLDVPGVTSAHVTTRHQGGTPVLVAYAAARSAPAPTAESLRAELARRLPAFLVPSTVVVLAELPFTGNGKVDEARLPEPVRPSAVADEPLPPLEASVRDAVSAVLGRTGLAPDALLTTLGANSLSFVRLSLALKQSHGVDVPISDLFGNPTITGIAGLVRAGIATDRPLPRVAEHGDVTPLSPQQQQIWFLRELSPDARAYNAQFSLHFEGSVDLPALERALAGIVADNEILRTVFTEVDGEPVQRVVTPWQPRVEVTDLREAGDPEARAAAAMHAAMRVPFDVEAVPLVRWHLYRLSASRSILLQVEHHFVHDGWTGALFLGEIRDRYAAALAGDRHDAAPGLRYRDFCHWYRQWTGTRDYGTQLRYWRAQLTGCREGVTFPADHARGAVQAFDGDCLRADVPAALVDRIDELCAAAGVSRFAVFLTSFALLAARHSGETDMVVGSAFANRRLPGTESVFGMFVNALPLRLRVAEDVAVRELAGSVMRVLLGAQDHQELPLVDVVKHVDLARDPRRNPLFQLMFAFHDSPMPRFDLPSLRGEFRIEHNGSAKNDVNVVCVPRAAAAGSGRRHDGVSVLWEYDKTLFRPETAHRLLGGFLHTLTALVDGWDGPVADVDVLPPAELTEVLALGTGPVVEPGHRTLPEGVLDQVERNPGAPAVVQGDRTVTYAGLRELADRIGHAVATLVPDLRGSVVAVTAAKSPEQTAAWLAVTRAGGTYLCLDHTAPAARLQLITRDAKPVLVLASAESAVFDDLGVPVVRIDDLPAAAPARVPAAAAEPSSPAYLTYTSGSTGEPKAVVTTHANAVTALTARTAHFGATAPTTLVTLPAVFDVAGSMTFWTLWLGGTVVLPEGDDARDPEAVRALTDRHRVTHVNFVASFYAQLLRSTPPGGWRPGLRVVAIGGEPCTTELVGLHARHLPGASLHNEYGPTEATVWCSAKTVYRPGQPASTDISIGTPLANYAMVVLDGRDHPAPVGARGQLHIAGPGVAAGYLGRDALTRERFAVPARGPLAGWRLYRTGDEARLRADGEFDLVGRLDDQVKVRGYRIELDEVRQNCVAHADVGDAYVSVDRTGGTDRLVAYVLPEEDREVTPAALRRWLAQRLPGYMVPSAIAVLPALPLTATGKVDRAALPPVRDETDAVDSEAARPTGPVESALADVWCAVLGRRNVGAEDDFFDLGGDSLLAIRMVARAQAAGVRVTVADLMRERTVRALAALGPADVAVAVRRPGGTVLPPTGIQSWFFAQDFADPDHFNQARIVRVAPEVTDTALTTGLVRLTHHHDAFRTTFTRSGDGPRVVLADAPAPVELNWHDVGNADDPALAAHADRVHASLSIADGRLWAFSGIRAASGERYLLLVLHHLIVDAVSWNVLLDDLGRAVHGELPGTAHGLPAAPPPEPDAAELAHWRALLTRAAADAGDRWPSATFADATVVTRVLSAAATRFLVDDAEGFDLGGPTALLLAALGRALGRTSDLYVFLEGHGRNDVPHAHEIVGWLTALYPVRLPAPAGDGLAETARAYRRQLDGVPGGGAGFTRARYQHGLTGHPADGLPQITVNYLGEQRTGAEAGPLVPVALPTGTPIAGANVLPTPVDVSAAVRDGRLTVRLAAADSALTPARAAGVLDDVMAALEELAGVVPLSTDGSGPARFFVHPVGGSVHWFRPLAERLRRTAAHGLTQFRGAGPAGIGELAENYLDRLAARGARSPLRLAGWSFGAAVAAEMAVRATARDVVVGALTLVDPPPLAPGERADPAVPAHLLSAVLPGWSAERVRAELDRLPAGGPRAQAQDLSAAYLSGADDPVLLDRVTTLLQNQAALEAWIPRGGLGHVTIVLSETTSARWRDLAGWRGLAASVDVHTVPGDHVSMLRDAGAERIAALLDQEELT